MDARWVVVCFVWIGVRTEVLDVLFESGKRLVVVDPASIPEGAEEYGDPKNTGSKLFDSSFEDNDNKRLSLLVLVARYRSQKSNYFRAHPTFVSCLQATMNDLQNEDKPVMIVSGYKPKGEVRGSTSLRDLYARAGTAAELNFRPGITGSLLHIAEVLLKNCPDKFDRINRNIGIIMMPDRIHVHMSGEDDEVPHFSSEGFSMNSEAFKTFAQDAIDAGLDPARIPDCGSVVGVESGQSYPVGLTPEQAVGSVDVPIMRGSSEDFLSLLQYQGNNVVIPNNNGGASWCGFEGNPCPLCQNGIVGNSVSKRCANRLMSVRMGTFLKVLQKMVRDKISNKLKITKAFVEPYDGQAEYPIRSLHVEGRQLLVELDSANTVANLKKVAQFAKCLGVDYVKHNGDHVILAVSKMKGIKAHVIYFPENNLIAVEPPFLKRNAYSLPAQFDEADEDLYPLFDTSEQMNDILALNTKVGLFASKDPEFRYMRLNPLIPKCFSMLDYYLNRFNEDGDEVTELEVVQGFMSSTEQRLKLDTFDQRFNSFILGNAMEVKYKEGRNPRNLTMPQLAQAMIDKCGPEFYQSNTAIGIGLYLERVFVDLREEFDVWTDDDSALPEGLANIQAYRGEARIRYDAAIEGRVIDPDDMVEANISANVPYMQSPDYVYRPPGRAPETSDEDCVPKRNTPFCAKTKQHRDYWIEQIWTEVSRKWFYHDKEEVREALVNCLGTCGTCLEGSIFEDKIKHCDNFLHWVPFSLLNERAITNIFPRDDALLRRHACNEHCIEDAELFHLIINAVDATWRPDPQQSVEHDLYPQSENPSPLMALLTRLYVTHATGRVKFWVQDNTDMSSMREPLQVAMMYNKNVTRIEVYVSSPGNTDAVDAEIESMKMDWATTGFTPVTREYLAPFTIHLQPEYIAKRDVDRSIGEELINNYANRELRWASREL